MKSPAIRARQRSADPVLRSAAVYSLLSTVYFRFHLRHATYCFSRRAVIPNRQPTERDLALSNRRNLRIPSAGASIDEDSVFHNLPARFRRRRTSSYGTSFSEVLSARSRASASSRSSIFRSIRRYWLISS